jgi:hypothetical protein
MLTHAFMDTHLGPNWIYNIRLIRRRNCHEGMVDPLSIIGCRHHMPRAAAMEMMEITLLWVQKEVVR